MPAVIDIKDLSKQFDAVKAVNEITLSIEQGEMFGIVGPDGAGKTTLLRLLTGILIPTSGSATILGYDLVRQSSEIKKEIGYLSQHFSLYSDLTIDENIEFFAEINEVFDFKERRNELLEFTRLTQFRNRLADQLSGGMKQKLALACTLIHHPKIIFLDEPTTGVDPVSRRDFWHILSHLLNEKITIIMSTPYLDEAERCGRIALVNNGKVMVVDTPQNLKQRMNGEVIEIIVDDTRRAASVLEQTSTFRDVQVFGDRLNVVVGSYTNDFPIIQQCLSDANITLRDWRHIQPSLENIFISLITQV